MIKEVTAGDVSLAAMFFSLMAWQDTWWYSYNRILMTRYLMMIFSVGLGPPSMSPSGFGLHLSLNIEAWVGIFLHWGASLQRNLWAKSLGLHWFLAEKSPFGICNLQWTDADAPKRTNSGLKSSTSSCSMIDPRPLFQILSTYQCQ